MYKDTIKKVRLKNRIYKKKFYNYDNIVFTTELFGELK